MNHDNLTDLLEARAADVPVGPPPLAEIHRAATARRRRSYGVALAAAAVVVTLGAVAVWPDGSASGLDNSSVASDPASSDVPPSGFRWGGIGQAAIAVPDEWPVNATRCGTPTRDTVVIDEVVVPTCVSGYPEGVTSVEVRPKNGVDDLLRWVPTQVDGEEALRSPAVAGEAYDGTTVFQTSVYLPTLEEAGFTAVEVVEERGQASPGFVLDVSPAPGTVIEPGSMVTVTVAR